MDETELLARVVGNVELDDCLATLDASDPGFNQKFESLRCQYLLGLLGVASLAPPDEHLEDQDWLRATATIPVAGRHAVAIPVGQIATRMGGPSTRAPTASGARART